MKYREILPWCILMAVLIKDNIFDFNKGNAWTSQSSVALSSSSNSSSSSSSSLAVNEKICSNDNNDNNVNKVTPRQANKERIPRTIFIFWESGWETAIPNAQLSIRTWTWLNPDFTVVALNGSTAEAWTHRSQYIPDEIWNQTTVQARSDVYRTLLLDRYGGIWVDASLFCNQPLHTWLDVLTHDDDDLFAFLRRGRMEVQLSLRLIPWVASWFLAAPPRSYMIRHVTETMTKHPKLLLSEYNWWHRIVNQLALEDDYVFRRIGTLFPSTLPTQCNPEKTPNFTLDTPLMKRCEINNMATTFLITTQFCCRRDELWETTTTTSANTNTTNAAAATWSDSDARINNNNNGTVFWNDIRHTNSSSSSVSSWQEEDRKYIQTMLCPRWNCHVLGANFAAVQELRARRPRKRQKLPSIQDPLFAGGG